MPKAGEIWLADIPFTSGVASKLRPSAVELRPRMRRSRAFLNLNPNRNLNLLSALEIKSKSMIKIRKHERSLNPMAVKLRPVMVLWSVLEKHERRTLLSSPTPLE